MVTKKTKSKATADSSAKLNELEFIKQISKSKVLHQISRDSNELLDEDNISMKRRVHFDHCGSKLMIDYEISSIEALREQSRTIYPRSNHRRKMDMIYAAIGKVSILTFLTFCLIGLLLILTS